MSFSSPRVCSYPFQRRGMLFPFLSVRLTCAWIIIGSAEGGRVGVGSSWFIQGSLALGMSMRTSVGIKGYRSQGSLTGRSVCDLLVVGRCLPVLHTCLSSLLGLLTCRK
ncbi:hypothetical protein BCR44DRAFT_371253 [Catenaria anguillulae PL171]|uniref:Uncharacterized protein n=1 Tax=Catenaria anguillulae PL171 TaxID=765915 RepID=A0A1Y2H4S1_9FUNG|nr:hypothetical protein BCR44DRAFT_371253 [Catenaria anguillulae PL171]